MQQNTEDRLTALERKQSGYDDRLSALELARRDQTTLDHALLNRIDYCIDDVRRVERGQERGFDHQNAQILDLKADLAEANANLKEVIEALREHKKMMEAVVVGQNQLYELQTGKPPQVND